MILQRGTKSCMLQKYEAGQLVPVVVSPYFLTFTFRPRPDNEVGTDQQHHTKRESRYDRRKHMFSSPGNILQSCSRPTTINSGTKTVKVSSYMTVRNLLWQPHTFLK